MFFLRLFSFLFLTILSSVSAADRIKDLTSLAGVRSNQLVGYGVVVAWLELEMAILELRCSQCKH